MPLLSAAFFDRDVVVVARELIGARLHKDGVALRITETEAYSGIESACHAYRGRTPRNAPMFGPPGRAYVYLCYGVHHLLNLTCGPRGTAAAVLIRACEPLSGLEVVQARRGGLSGPRLLTGPGKVGASLELSVSDSGSSAISRGGLEVRKGAATGRVVCGCRIGIDFARPEHRALEWRFADADSAWVSHRSKFSSR